MAEVATALDAFGVRVSRARRVASGHDGVGEANWHVWPLEGSRCVLRRRHDRAKPDELAYEAAVMRAAAGAGFVVPEHLVEPVVVGARWWTLHAYVPGRLRRQESTAERLQRGRDLARLEHAVRDLGATIGQRPRWRAQHEGPNVHTDIGWTACVAAVREVAPQVAGWMERAAVAAATELHELGAAALPLTVVHGEFHEGNVHYDGPRLAGVIDFALCHLDSRPYELAIARTYRTPEVRDGYRSELARLGWPLSDLEEACIEPVHRAFRVDMAAWFADAGRRHGSWRLDLIESQLARTGVSP